MGAPEHPNEGAGGDAPEQHVGSVGHSSASGDLSVDYEWLTQQLAQLGAQLDNVRVEDEVEDEVRARGMLRHSG